MRTALVGLLGLWAGLLLAAGAAATLNFKAVDRALGPQGSPELRNRLAPLTEDERRSALRHAAAESNRSLFALSGWAQAALALVAVGLAWPLGGPARGLTLALAVALGVQQLAFAGPMIAFGRQLDFLPRPWPAELARRFGLLHAGYSLLELAKLGMLVGAALLSRR